eukprot:2923155-Pyramimonas_sp.AAC.1
MLGAVIACCLLMRLLSIGCCRRWSACCGGAVSGRCERGGAGARSSAHGGLTRRLLCHLLDFLVSNCTSSVSDRLKDGSTGVSCSSE